MKRINTKKLLFFSGSLITVAGATSAIVYSNMQKPKALLPLVGALGITLGIGWMFNNGYKLFEREGHKHVQKEIDINTADLKNYKSDFETVKATAHLKLDYKYTPTKRGLFWQDYVDWSAKAESYIELPGKVYAEINEIDQNLSTWIGGIGSPSIDVVISPKSGVNFGLSFGINGHTINEGLSLQNAQKLTSFSENKAWIWSYWSFYQNLRSSFKIKNTLYTFITKDN